MSSIPVRNIGLISNPHSGHNRDHFEAIAHRIAQIPEIRHCITQSADEVPEALQQFAAAGVEVLAINGGDGTASGILGTMIEGNYFQQTPRIVLLPGGTANMNAGDIGVPGHLQKAVRRFCQWAQNPQDKPQRIEQRHLLRLSTASEARARYGMFLGGGAIMQGTEYAHQEIHSRGLKDDFSLALGTARTIWGVFRRDPDYRRHQAMELSLDGGQPRAHDALVLAISTLERLAFGMRPFWGEGPGPVRMTLMEQDCSKFVRTFLAIIRGKPGRNAIPESGYFSDNAHSIELAMTGSLNLDGEIIQVNGGVSISNSPQLEFLIL